MLGLHAQCLSSGSKKIDRILGEREKNVRHNDLNGKKN